MPYKAIIKIITGIFLVSALLCLAGVAWLPGFVESVIVQKVSKSLALEVFECRVEKIGVSNTLLRNIRTKNTLSIDTIAVHYSLKELLLKQEISSVTISGLKLNLILDKQNTLTIEDMKHFPVSGKTPAPNDRFPYLPRQIDITSSTINIRSDNDTAGIPLSASFSIVYQNDTIDIQGQINPFNETVTVSGTMNLTTGISSSDVDSKDFNLKKLSDIINVAAPGIKLSGRADIHIANRNIRETTVSVSFVHIDQPFAGDIHGIQSDITFESGRVNAAGSFIAGPFLGETIGVAYSMLRHPDLPDEMKVDIETRPLPEIKASYQGKDITVVSPALAISLKGNFLEGKASVLASSGNFQMKNGEGVVSATGLTIKSYADYDLTKTGSGLKMIIHTDLKNIRMKSPLMDAGCNARFSGKILLDKTLVPQVTLDTWLEDGWGNFDPYKISIRGVDAFAPLSYPAVSEANQGRITIKECTYDQKYVSKIDGFLKQTGEKNLDVWGTLLFPQIDEFKTSFDVKAEVLPTSDIRLSMTAESDSFKFTPKKLGKLIPESLSGIDFTFNMASKADIVFSENKLTSRLSVDISDSDFSWPKNKVYAEKINTRLEFDDILSFRSRPKQVMTVAQLKAHDLRMSDIVVRYDIESMNSVLVENIRFKWCNGHITTEAFRFPDKQHDYTVTLYCDRLEMSQLLEQVGAFQAQGAGTLNGRIPVSISKGLVSFDNGFLFSTPGSGGKIIIKDTHRLLAGIPPNTVEFAQLDLAGEALKNYEYQWAKMVFNTDGDTLELNLQFDGQPANPVLPFEFKKDLGMFVRVDASNPGSRFQGIKLDVNLKLPFDQVVKFSNQINELIK